MINLIIINDYGYVNGGTSKVAISSLNNLADAGFNVTFIYGVGPLDPSIDALKVKVIDLNASHFEDGPLNFSTIFNGLWNFKVANNLKKILSQYENKNTLIHVHGWTKSLSSSIFKIIVASNFKAVITLHDYFSVCPNGGLYNYRLRSKCQLRPMSFNCLASNCDSRSFIHKIYRVIRFFLQNELSNVRLINNYIVISEFSKNIFLKFLPKNISLHLVRNPIEVQKNKSALAGNNNIFSYVGRLSPEKGCDLFALATKNLKINTEFIGEGPDILIIKALNSSSVFHGWRSSQEVNSFIANSRALVFPSLWQETQGLVVAEAAAAGIPVIASNSSAARDFIIDEVTGLLFETGDVNHLQEKIKILNDDPAFATKLGLAAYHHYWSKPSSSQVHCAHLKKFYLDLLGDHFEQV
jgi:glycosyltransferase involved in cell wall biosynthesis